MKVYDSKDASNKINEVIIDGKKAEGAIYKVEVDDNKVAKVYFYPLNAQAQPYAKDRSMVKDSQDYNFVKEEGNKLYLTYRASYSNNF